MKKLIILTLIAALVLTLCACGAENIISVDPETETEDPAVLRSNLDSASAYLESCIDTSKMVTAMQEDDPNYLYKYWSYDDDEFNASFSTDVELDGKTFTVGKTTVGELKEMGYELMIDEETVPTDYSKGFSIVKGDKFCNLTADNNTDKEQNIYDLVVTGFNGFSEEYGLEYSFNGIATGSTLEEVVAALGTPNYNISLSSDSLGTTFDMSYYNDKPDGDILISDVVTVYLTYDVAGNTAVVSSLDVSHNVENMIPDEEAE